MVLVLFSLHDQTYTNSSISSGLAYTRKFGSYRILVCTCCATIYFSKWDWRVYHCESCGKEGLSSIIDTCWESHQ